MRESVLRVGLSTVLAVLAGCAVGPDYHRPDFPAGELQHFKSELPAGSETADGADQIKFWERFQDPTLSSLVTDALKNNSDIRVSWSSYQAAAALLQERKFDRFPTVQMQGEVGHLRQSVDEANGSPRSADQYGLSARASWELDLVGRVRRDIESRSASVEARNADIAAMQVVVVSELSTSYFRLRGARWRKKIAIESLDAQRELLEIVQARAKYGRESELEVARQRSLLKGTAASIPVYDAQIALEEHRLAVLTGRVPGTLKVEAGLGAEEIGAPPLISPGSPLDMLRRRPDVRAAEARLHAATANVGVATADLFPKLTLGAALGTFSFTGSKLFSSQAESNSVLLGIDWSFLDVGRVRSRIAAANAESEGQLAQYQKAVLEALGDAESAIVRSTTSGRRSADLDEAFLDARRALAIATRRYTDGRIGSFELLDAQKAALAAQDAFAESRVDQSLAAVSLYAALAGGWPDASPDGPQNQNNPS